MEQATAYVVGFMDLGTNSVRLLLVRIRPNHSHTVITQQKEMVRLGEGEFVDGRLKPAAIERTVLVCRKFAEMARSHDAQEIVAVATSATREAKNQVELLRRLEGEAQLDMRVISGQEEARLIYQGVASGEHLSRRNALFIDIGGGSTEMIVGDQQRYQYLNSLKLGAIRLTSLFFPDAGKPIPLKQYDQARQYVRNTAVRAVQSLRKLNYELVVGSSGTIENLANIAARVLQNRQVQKPEHLTYANLVKVVELLRGMPLEERRKVPGLTPERADIILGGAAILDALMEELGIEEIRTSARGLRDGLLVDYLARMVDSPSVREMSVRARSVLRLGRLCNFDETHAAHTSRLALELFDSSKEIGLHALGDWERELLGWAAQLHDIGTFLSYTNHQVHSHYFIRNADLLGFNQEEVAIIAAAVLFHRRVVPRKKHAEYAALAPRAQEIVLVLCVLLRMAESLDRSHAGLIESARFSLVGKRGLRLQLHSTRECQLEVWGVQTHQAAVEEVFKRKLKVAVKERPQEQG